MTTTSDRPISVDGVRLDTLAWNIEAVKRAAPAKRERDAQVAGVDGLIPSLNDDYEPGSLSLSMFVRGTDVDGVVPAEGQVERHRANLDELLHLFSKRHALLEVQEVLSATETRRAWAKVTDRIEPDEATLGHYSRFAVLLSLPYAFWEDLNTADWSQAGVVSGTPYEVTTLEGATAPITDAVVTLTGPASAGAKISDPATGAYVTLANAISAGDTWRVNVGTWATRLGTGLGLASADTDGTDQTAATTSGGSRARYLPLTPVRSGGLRKVSVQVDGTGFTAATAVAVRARRKFLT